MPYTRCMAGTASALTYIYAAAVLVHDLLTVWPGDPWATLPGNIQLSKETHYSLGRPRSDPTSWVPNRRPRSEGVHSLPAP